jgi:hypothetical protein
MKPFNEVQHWKKEFDEEARQKTLDTIIAVQILGLEKLIENNGAYVKSPLAYNILAGLIDQVKYYAYAAFIEPEKMLDREMNSPSHGETKKPVYE